LPSFARSSNGVAGEMPPKSRHRLVEHLVALAEAEADETSRVGIEVEW
jgi:hypothetical protein